MEFVIQLVCKALARFLLLLNLYASESFQLWAACKKWKIKTSPVWRTGNKYNLLYKSDTLGVKIRILSKRSGTFYYTTSQSEEEKEECSQERPYPTTSWDKVWSHKSPTANPTPWVWAKGLTSSSSVWCSEARDLSSSAAPFLAQRILKGKDASLFALPGARVRAGPCHTLLSRKAKLDRQGPGQAVRAGCILGHGVTSIPLQISKPHQYTCPPAGVFHRRIRL